MFKVLLIDDEPIITRGLQLIIERSDLPCEIVGVAHNGEQGVTLALELCPDIIITDICMPEMDGLEIITQLKKSTQSFKFIILSGFLEFEYAKKAMFLEVKHFVTKPVEEKDLFVAISNSIEEINKEMEKTKNLKALKESFVENQDHLFNYTLRDLLIQSVEAHELMDYFLPENFFPPNSNQFSCVLLDFWEIEKVDFVENYGAIINVIENYLEKFLCVKNVLYDIQKIAVIIVNSKPIDYEELKKTIANMATTLMLRNKEIAVGIGLIYPNIRDLSKSFENAKQALDFWILRRENSVVAFDEIIDLPEEEIAVDAEILAVLQNHIKQLNETAAMETLDLLFESFRTQHGLTPLALQLKCLSVLLLGTKELSLTEYQLNDFLGKDVFSLGKISKFQNLDKLLNWMKNVVRSIIALKVVRNDPKENSVIDNVIAYLDQNYSNEINLQLLSEKFFINPYYLSQLFKEKTGELYLNYLTSLRMSKAKYLLAKTDYKIYDISLQVGYSDTSYFSRLFERNTGSKPSKYRKEQQKES